METFLLLDLWTFSFHQLFNFSYSFPPLGDHFPAFYQYHTVAKPLLSSLVPPQSSAAVTIGEVLHLHDFLPIWQIQPLSTPRQFTCQLLFVVAKVIYSVSVLPWRTFSLVNFPFPFLLSSQRFKDFHVAYPSPFFYDFFLQRLAFPSNRRISHAAQKPAVLPLTPSSKSALFIKACSARCFLPP